MLSCREYAVGSGGTVNVEYSSGGQAVVLVPDSVLQNSGLCQFVNANVAAAQPSEKVQQASSAFEQLRRPVSGAALLVLIAAGSMASGLWF